MSLLRLAFGIFLGLLVAVAAMVFYIGERPASAPGDTRLTEAFAELAGATAAGPSPAATPVPPLRVGEGAGGEVRPAGPPSPAATSVPPLRVGPGHGRPQGAAPTGTAVGGEVARTGGAASPELMPGEQLLADLYRRAAPGVVFITTESVRGRQGGEFPRRGAGSGFVIDQDGSILTNNHVVDGSGRITVALDDGTEVPARIVGRDPGNDLALIKVDVRSDLLHPLPLGDSDRLVVGQWAIAIGNPFGLTRSFTVGVVSAVDRTRPGENGRAIRRMIQTDAAMNPGNSGGPLLNSRGEVVGVNSSIESPVRGSVGVGFAVPINTAKRLLPRLRTGGEIKHPFLGISGLSVTPALAGELGLSVEEGVYILSTEPGGPAAEAGVRSGTGTSDRRPGRGGDIIVAIDGRPIRSIDDVAAALDERQVSDTVTLEVVRASERLSLPAKLAAWPDRPAQP